MGWMDFAKKALKLSNPVSAIAMGIEQVTGKDLMPKVKINGVETSLTGNNVLDVASGAAAFETGRQEIAANDKLSSDLKKDEKSFEKFKSQDLDNPGMGDELFTPKYRRNSSLMKQQEAMMGLFNARKNQILNAQRTPGISQTRF